MMNLIKKYQKTLLLPFAIGFTFFCLLLETLKYPGFIGNHFYIDAKVYFAVAITLLLFLDTKQKSANFVLRVNRILLVPIFLVYFGFALAEGAHFTNYVLATYHFHLDGLVFVPLFSLSIFVTEKFKDIVPKTIGKIGLVYPLMVFLLVFFMVKNITYVSDTAFNRNSYILFHLRDNYDDKMFYQWQDFYRFMVFVRNNTPTYANIVVSPMQDPWLIGTGNPHFVRAFLYPRKIIQEEKIIPDLSVFGPNTFILISWGKEECKPEGCHGWPRQNIQAKKITYKDPDSEKVIETKENAVYRLEDDQYVYGIIEL